MPNLLASSVIMTANAGLTAPEQLGRGPQDTAKGLPAEVILAAIPDSMLQVGRNGLIQGYQPAAGGERCLAVTDPVGRPLTAVLPPTRARQATDAVARTLETGEQQLFEYELAKGSKTMYFEARVTKADAERLW